MKDKAIKMATAIGITLVEVASICGAWALASALGLGLGLGIMLVAVAGVMAPFALAAVMAVSIVAHKYWLDWRETQRGGDSCPPIGL